MLKNIEKKSLKVFLKKMDKLGFNKLIIPSSKVIVNNISFSDKIGSLKKEIDYLAKTKHPFYLCNGDKCLKVKNKKGWYKLANNKIGKCKLKNGEYGGGLLNIVFPAEKFENKAEIIDKIKRQNKKKTVFDLDIFVKNIKQDLSLVKNKDYNIIKNEDNNLILFTHKKTLNQKNSKRIINYFKTYEKKLKELGINKNIEISLIIDVNVKS